MLSHKRRAHEPDYSQLAWSILADAGISRQSRILQKIFHSTSLQSIHKTSSNFAHNDKIYMEHRASACKRCLRHGIIYWILACKRCLRHGIIYWILADPGISRQLRISHNAYFIQLHYKALAAMFVTWCRIKDSITRTAYTRSSRLPSPTILRALCRHLASVTNVTSTAALHHPHGTHTFMSTPISNDISAGRHLASVTNVTSTAAQHHRHSTHTFMSTPISNNFSAAHVSRHLVSVENVTLISTPLQRISPPIWMFTNVRCFPQAIRKLCSKDRSSTPLNLVEHQECCHLIGEPRM